MSTLVFDVAMLVTPLHFIHIESASGKVRVYPAEALVDDTMAVIFQDLHDDFHVQPIITVNLSERASVLRLITVHDVSFLLLEPYLDHDVRTFVVEMLSVTAKQALTELRNT